MTAAVHPAAPHHLPPFITAPGETDVLMVVTSVIVVLAVLGFGLLFLRIHTLPERIAHKGHKLQFEIVAVLGLISLFTHMHIFWILGLLLALIDIPDFGGSLSRIAGSTEKMAGLKPGEGAVDLPGEIFSAPPQHEDAAHEPPNTGKPRESATVVPARPELAAARTGS